MRNSKNFIRLVLLAVLFFNTKAVMKAQIPAHLNHIIYASPYTNFYGGRGFGLLYEYYLNSSKRFSLAVPVSFGVRDYYVIHANSSRHIQSGTIKPPESKNYSFMLHPGIKFYAGKNTSFLSYAIGTSTFLSYGTEDGFKMDLDNPGRQVLYRYSAGKELRWGGMFDQYLNFRISERVLMEIQGSLGFVHLARFLPSKNNPTNSSYGNEVMGLIGIRFGCRL